MEKKGTWMYFKEKEEKKWYILIEYLKVMEKKLE
jgi:hypothetical protein